MSYFSKSSLIGGIDNYANTAPVEVFAKKTVAFEGNNANLLLNSRDRNSGTIKSKKLQQYNNFSLQKGFPILQGQINSIKVDEVKFPTPFNITPYNNRITFYTYDNTGTIIGGGVEKVFPPGFYTGDQLATELDTFLTGQPTLGLSVAYNAQGQYVFTFSAPITPPIPVAWGVAPSAPGNAVTSQDVENSFNTTPEDLGLLWTLGFNAYLQSPFYITQPTFKTGVAPLLYTQYIDICSDVLTQYQELTDTSTDSTNPNHIICRLYIANETSVGFVDTNQLPIVDGCVYCMIHRQFKNPKVIRWNGQNSVDRVDIRLYDDQGRPLWTPPEGAVDFQITLSAVEM